MVVHNDDGVGSEHDLSAVSLCYNFCFLSRQALSVLHGALAGMRVLSDIGHVNREGDAGAAQQLGPARRSGGEDDSGNFHSPPILPAANLASYGCAKRYRNSS